MCAALAEESRRHVAAPELRRGRASRCLMCAHSRVCGFGRPANWAARDMMRYCVCCGGAGGRPDATPAQRILAFVASLLVCEAFCTMTSPVSISVAPGDALHNSKDAFLIASMLQRDITLRVGAYVGLRACVGSVGASRGDGRTTITAITSAVAAARTAGGSHSGTWRRSTCAMRPPHPVPPRQPPRDPLQI